MKRVYSQTIEVPGRLWTLNGERKFRHWSERSNQTAIWRHAVAVEAKSAHFVPMQPARIRIVPMQRSGVLADVGAHFPVAKAAIDGLVDAGFMDDDSPRHLIELTMSRPVRADHDGLVITMFQLVIDAERDIH